MTASNRAYRLWLTRETEPEGNGRVVLLNADHNRQSAPWDKTLAVYGWWTPYRRNGALVWEIAYHRRYLSRDAARSRAASIEKHNPGVTVTIQRSKPIDWEPLRSSA